MKSSLRAPSDAVAGEATFSGNATIVLIDHRVLLRDCLVRCFSQTGPDHVVLGFSSVTEWTEVEKDYPPAAVVVFYTSRSPADIDSHLPFVTHDGSVVPVVIISENENADDVRSALESGAKGYIPTSLSLEMAISAIKFIEAGGTFVPVSVLTSQGRIGEAPSRGLFTERQAAVLECLRRGKANKQIAYELSMCEGTVKVHVRNIMKKLKARNRTEVAVLANPLLRRENS
jgi:DNA-binding NarL/FixJ family response regulator